MELGLAGLVCLLGQTRPNNRPGMKGGGPNDFGHGFWILGPNRPKSKKELKMEIKIN